MTVRPTFQMMQRFFKEEKDSIKYYCPIDSFYCMVYFISMYLQASRKTRNQN